ncbi:MAG TPA: hypothetical protein VMJ64_02515, partial [Anaerolineales bacterium]|nr:hypothetical protein [Anaerolineales bacterium]
MSQSNPQTANRLAIAGILLGVCCLCAIGLAFGGGIVYYLRQNAATVRGVPPRSDTTPTAGPTVAVNRPNVDSVSKETESTLQQTTVPDSDLYDLACRLKDICGVSHTLPAPSTPFQVGDQQKFWIMNSDTTQNFQVDCTLRYITPHSYFWIEDGVDAKDADIKALMDTFETKIYPT